MKEPAQPLETTLIVFADPKNPNLELSQDQVKRRKELFSGIGLQGATPWRVGYGVKEPSQPLETTLIVFADPKNPSLELSQDQVTQT